MRAEVNLAPPTTSFIAEESLRENIFDRMFFFMINKLICKFQ